MQIRFFFSISWFLLKPFWNFAKKLTKKYFRTIRFREPAATPSGRSEKRRKNEWRTFFRRRATTTSTSPSTTKRGCWTSTRRSSDSEHVLNRIYVVKHLANVNLPNLPDNNDNRKISIKNIC